MAKKGLGRGLSALLDYDDSTHPDTEGETAVQPQTQEAGGVVYIDIRKIEPNRQQPRQYFNDDSLQELSESIKSFGVIQPLIVKANLDYYTIIAGERRFRAARMAKVETLPVIIKDYSEMETLQIALIENIQRQDLTPIEEASCYKRLMDDFFFTQEDIAAKIGKNRNAISNMVRLLDLDERIQNFVNEGKLTASHARALLTVKDGNIQFECAERIIAEELSVRAAENLIAAVLDAQKAIASETEDKKNETPMADAAYQASKAAFRHVEDELKTILGAKVNIHYGKKKGKIEIEYYSPEELDRLLCLFKNMHNQDNAG